MTKKKSKITSRYKHAFKSKLTLKNTNKSKKYGIKNNKFKLMNNNKLIVYKDRRSCSLLNKDNLYLLYLYIGITNNIISGNSKSNVKYNLFYGKNEIQNKMLNNTKSVKLIDKLRCFFYTSDMNKIDYILLYDLNDDINNYLFISFNIGMPKYYETTKPLYYYIKKDEININDNENQDNENQDNENQDNENKNNNHHNEKTDKNHQHQKIIHRPRFYELIILISKIKSYLETDKYKKIVLCGHSRGMSIATFCAYILLILSVDDDFLNTLPEHHDIKGFMQELKSFISDNQKQELLLKEKLVEIKNKTVHKTPNTQELQNMLSMELKELHKFNLMSKDILNLKSIRTQLQNNIYICGTGGYPILWTKIEEFNIFNNFYQNHYIHIISGIKDNNIQIYDNLTYYNKFIYIYEKILEDYATQPHSYQQDKRIAKLKQMPTIKYVYYNFGGIILNLVNNYKIKCFKIDTIFNKIKTNDNKNIIQNINFKTRYLNNYHKFEFYRTIFNKFMKFL